MAIESPILPQMLPEVLKGIDKLARATEQQAAATLAAAIITTRGKPISVQEALEIATTIQYATHPPLPGHPNAPDWKAHRTERLAKVHD